jgi:hypothetical protein
MRNPEAFKRIEGEEIKKENFIEEASENPTLENKRKVIDLFYGIPEQKGWLEEEEPKAREALKRILESKLFRGTEGILILKEIELLAGIKGIKSQEDIKKIKEAYPQIVKKNSRELKDMEKDGLFSYRHFN